MADSLRMSLTLISVLGCGVVAGVFFAFSTVVMSALGRLQPKEGILAMQSINVTAINPLFMLALFGTGATCLVLAISAVLRGPQPNTVYLLAGSLLYLLGTVVVTIAFNVPLNNALAIAPPNSPDSAALWARYLSQWTLWNHVRTVTSLIAAALLAIAL